MSRTDKANTGTSFHWQGFVGRLADQITLPTQPPEAGHTLPLTSMLSTSITVNLLPWLHTCHAHDDPDKTRTGR